MYRVKHARTDVLRVVKTRWAFQNEERFSKKPNVSSWKQVNSLELFGRWNVCFDLLRNYYTVFQGLRLICQGTIITRSLLTLKPIGYVLNASGSDTLWYYLQMVWNWVWTYKYSHDTMISESLYVVGQESGELDNGFKCRPGKLLLKKVGIIWEWKLKWLERYELGSDGFKSF
jgi:hypothetical protein